MDRQIEHCVNPARIRSDLEELTAAIRINAQQVRSSQKAHLC